MPNTDPKTLSGQSFGRPAQAIHQKEWITPAGEAVQTLQPVFPMVNGQPPLQIACLVQPALTASPDTPVEEIKKLIGEDQPLEAVVVLEGDLPVGLVMSLHMDRALSQRFGVSLYYDRPVSRIMDPSPLVVEADARLETVARAAMNREKTRMYDDVVVVRNGRLQGTVSVRRNHQLS